MAYLGVRILSLDGGGTRGLPSLYVLREIMEHVSPGQGGSVRPAEYFNLIGGTGLNGLCALLFVHFYYTVDQAIEFLLEVSHKLDDVEVIRSHILKGRLQEEDEHWVDSIHDHHSPLEQLEELRGSILEYKWRTTIEKNISHVDKTQLLIAQKLGHSYPSMILRAGRSKALIISSESPGYGDNNGIHDSRQYHTPVLHRTYACRHGDIHYPCLSVQCEDCQHGTSPFPLMEAGLASIACPDIIKSGINLPSFSVTGGHHPHNPIHILLEESRKIWPGLQPGLLISIGCGIFEISQWDFNQLNKPIAEKCLHIVEKNREIHEEIKQYILPHDKRLKSTYLRFETSEPIPFFEYYTRSIILEDIQTRSKYSGAAATYAQAAAALTSSNFPTTSEDFLTLSFLSSLLSALLELSYMTEAEILSDIIYNFILYEGASGGDGSFQKVLLASHVGQVADLISGLYDAYDQEDKSLSRRDALSEGSILNGLMTVGDKFQSETDGFGPMKSLSDIAAGCYFLSVTSQRKENTGARQERFDHIMQQLSPLINPTLGSSQTLLGSSNSVLELAALASLCQAATLETLRGAEGLLYNGALINRLCQAVIDHSWKGLNEDIFEPIADAMALSIRLGNWSTFRDESIVQLLSTVPKSRLDAWSFANLAVERMRLKSLLSSSSVSDKQITRACEDFLQRMDQSHGVPSIDLVICSTVHGHFGLLEKFLTNRGLMDTPELDAEATPEAGNFLNSIINEDEDTLIHICARLGFGKVLRLISEYIHPEVAEQLVNQENCRGQTPLHLACTFRAPTEVFDILFQMRAAPNAQCNLGRTPLHYCFPDQELLPDVQNLIVELIHEYALPVVKPTHKLEIRSRRDEKSWKKNSRASDFERIIEEMLLRQDIKFNIQDDQGMTALHRAAANGWGDNLYLFFSPDSTDFEDMRCTALNLRDSTDQIILDHSRAAGSYKVIVGEADFITAEMTKRGLEIPPEPTRFRLGNQLGTYLRSAPGNAWSMTAVPMDDDIRGILSYKLLETIPERESIEQSPTSSTNQLRHRALYLRSLHNSRDMPAENQEPAEFDSSNVFVFRPLRGESQSANISTSTPSIQFPPPRPRTLPPLVLDYEHPLPFEKNDTEYSNAAYPSYLPTALPPSETLLSPPIHQQALSSSSLSPSPELSPDPSVESVGKSKSKSRSRFLQKFRKSS